MPRTFKPNLEREAPAWLKEQVYAPKRQRTVELVKQAVDALQAEQKRVSLASVAAKSRQVDPEGVGVSESAILTNDEARTYYEQHRTWRSPRSRRTAVTESPSAPAPVRVKPDRNVARVRQRYMRLSKQELADRLVTVEQAYAEHEDRWLRLNDELLSVKLQAEHPALNSGATRTVASAHGSPDAGQADRLLRRIDGMQRALDAKEAVIRRLRHELQEVYTKAAGTGLTDNDLRHAIQSALTRAEKAEHRLADLRAQVFTQKAMKMARYSRKWQPNRRKGKATSH